MSKRLVCDKCHQFIAEESISDPNCTLVFFYDPYIPDDKKHLCPECTKKFYKFLEEETKKKK